MTLAGRILVTESRQLLRSRIGVGMAMLVLASGAYGIAAGTAQMQSQAESIDALQAKESARLEALRTATGPATYAMSIDGDAARVVYDPPAALSGLAVGQRDVLPFYRHVSGRTLVYDGAGIHFDGMADDIANPERLLTGNFDLAFVLVFLVPLALIAVSYDVLSGDREAGTFALWAASGTAPPAIVGWRLIGRALPLLLLSALLVVLGALWAGAPPAAAADVARMVVVAWASQAWWLGMALLLIAADRSSAVTALTLFVAYLAVTVVGPAAMGLAMDVLAPPRSHAASALLIRDRNDALWGEIDHAAWEQFHQAMPEVPRDAAVNLEPLLEDALGYGKKIVVWHYLMDAIALPELDRYLSGLGRRDVMTRRVHAVAPAVLTADLLAAIARTDVRAHLAFQDAIRSFQAANGRRLRALMFPGTPLSQADLPLYPAYRPPALHPLRTDPSFLRGLATLLATTLALVSLGWWRLTCTFRPR